LTGILLGFLAGNCASGLGMVGRAVAVSWLRQVDFLQYLRAGCFQPLPHLFR
jgi:hypothetical protein